MSGTVAHRMRTLRISIACAIVVTILGPATPAFAASYSISDQASCEALPVASTWTGTTKECRLDANMTLPSADTLGVGPAASLRIPTGVTLSNSGTITVNGKLFVTGSLSNSGTIDNNFFWDIRGDGTVDNLGSGTVITSNQLHVAQGSFTNAGSLTNENSISFIHVGTSSSFSNSGSLTNEGKITNDGSFSNSGSITNNGTVRSECATFVNTGTITGTPIEDPHCMLVDGGEWDNPSRWSHGTVPSSVDEAIVRGTATVDFALARSARTVLRGHLVIQSDGSLTNSGEMVIGTGGQLPGTFQLVVQGTAQNHATMLNNDTIRVVGGFTNYDTITPSGVVGIIKNEGSFLNLASASIRGGLENQAGAHFRNFGTFDLNRSTNHNAGLLEVGLLGALNLNNDLINQAGGRINNRGLLTINHALSNPGDLVNEANGVIFNTANIDITASTSSWTNAGNVENRGAIDNGGTLGNTGSICGDGTITGNAVDGTAPVVSCKPSIDLGPGASLFEGGTAVVGDVFFDPGIPSTFSAIVAWGDGTETHPIVTSVGTTLRSFSSSHRYADNGIFILIARVCDDAGECGDDTAVRVVQNVAPTVTVSGPPSIDEGDHGTFTFSITDPGADTFSVAASDIACGSGGSLVAGSFTFGGAAGSFACAYAEGPATPTASVTATDDDGGVGTGSTSASVVNLPPVVGTVTVPVTPSLVGTSVGVEASFSDPGAEDAFTAVWDWGDGTTSAGTVDLAGGTVSGTHEYAGAGLYHVSVMVTDDDGASGSGTAQEFVIVYDPAGLVNGGGAYESPAGAFPGDPARVGSFRFSGWAKYNHDATTPDGRVEIRLGSEVLFKSTDLSWLIVSQPHAYLVGNGRFQGAPGFAFLLTAYDGEATDGEGADRIRLKVWEQATGDIVYDSQPGGALDAAASTPLSRGSLTIRAL